MVSLPEDSSVMMETRLMVMDAIIGVTLSLDGNAQGLLLIVKIPMAMYEVVLLVMVIAGPRVLIVETQILMLEHKVSNIRIKTLTSTEVVMQEHIKALPPLIKQVHYPGLDLHHQDQLGLKTTRSIRYK